MTASNLTLRFLGAGGAFSRRYGTTCSVLELPGGGRWLVDCGRQAPEQLHDVGLSWHDIDGQLVTHVHGDHTYGLEEFAFSRFFHHQDGVAPIRLGGPRPRLVCHSAVRAELWESLASSLKYVPDGDNPVAGTLDTFFERVDPTSAEPPRSNPWPHAETFELAGYRVVARETVHVPGKPSTSLEITALNGATGKAAWWSGDSTVDVAFLVAQEPRISVFFHDCTFVEYPGQVHGAFGVLETLPESVRTKMVLMHHEDDLDDHLERALSLGFRVGLPGHVYDLVTGQRI